MTTPTGQISALDINTELGKPTIAQMSLDDSDVRALAGISTGMISFGDLRGKSSVIVDLQDADYTAYSTYKVCTSSCRVNASGFVQEGFDGSYSNDYQWVNPTTAVNDYEVLATNISDSVIGPTTWTACNTSPTWIVAAPIGISFGSFTLQIRKIGTTTILDTANITLEAEVLF